MNESVKSLSRENIFFLRHLCIPFLSGRLSALVSASSIGEEKNYAHLVNFVQQLHTICVLPLDATFRAPFWKARCGYFSNWWCCLGDSLDVEQIVPSPSLASPLQCHREGGEGY